MGGRAKVAASEARGMLAVSFAEAMGMMEDKERVEAFFKRLDALKVEINEGLGKAATIDQIDRLLLQARTDQNMASEELSDARGKAESLIAAARAKSCKEVGDRDAKSQARERVVISGEKKLAEDESRFNANVQTWHTDLAKREAQLADQKQLTARKLDEAGKLKKRYETALAVTKAGVAAA